MNRQRREEGLEQLIREQEDLLDRLADNLARIKAFAGYPGRPSSPRASGGAADLRRTIEEQRERIMAQAEAARQDAMRSAQEKMASAGGFGGMPGMGMPGMLSPAMLPAMAGSAGRAVPAGVMKKPHGGSDDDG